MNAAGVARAGGPASLGMVAGCCRGGASLGAGGPRPTRETDS
jgi:hypothetical protein